MKFRLVEEFDNYITFEVTYRGDKDIEKLCKETIKAPEGISEERLKEYAAKILTLSLEDIQSIKRVSGPVMNNKQDELLVVAKMLGTTIQPDGSIEARGLRITTSTNGYKIWHRHLTFMTSQIKNCKTLSEVKRFVKNYLEKLAERTAERP